MKSQLEAKAHKLEDLLAQMKSVVVAFSGGVDSSVLLKFASTVLGERALGIVAKSPTFPATELQMALAISQLIGANCIVIETDELSDPRFAGNPPERCYYCKLELFGKLKDIAQERGMAWVLDGSNADDVRDIRPGTRAARELGVRSPLKEAGLCKQEIRELAKAAGLPNWSKPAQACLASRFPYGQSLTSDGLERVALAENVLQRLGFSQVRVRVHGEVARIEVPPDELDRLLAPGVRDEVALSLKKLGFLFLAADLEGYRTGSLNEALRGRKGP